MKEKVKQALNKIRPALQAGGGDVKLVSVDEDRIVKVQLQGACYGCPMSQLTLQHGIDRNLKDLVPEVKQVVAL